MFEDGIEVDHLHTTLDLPEAVEVLRAALPDAKVTGGGAFTVFDLGEGDAPWGIVTAVAEDPTLIEVRYLAGIEDRRCAHLRAEVMRLFAAAAVVRTAPAVLAFRESLLKRMRSLREYGIRIRNLAFGPPADPEVIARIERDHLGFALPAEVRDFFAAHDGLTVFFHKVDDPTAEVYDHAVPLAIEAETPITWGVAMHDGGPIWRAIDVADYGNSPTTGPFYAGLICIPSLTEIFDTDWARSMGWPPGMWLFDAFHPYYGSALVVDRAARTLHIQPTSDHGADLDAAPVSVADYLQGLLNTGGTDRTVDGRSLAVRFSG